MEPLSAVLGRPVLDWEWGGGWGRLQRAAEGSVARMPGARCSWGARVGPAARMRAQDLAPAGVQPVAVNLP